jgi:hypothetical protein
MIDVKKFRMKALVASLSAVWGGPGNAFDNMNVSVQVVSL